jgi:hypothetical protein
MIWVVSRKLCLPLCFLPTCFTGTKYKLLTKINRNWSKMFAVIFLFSVPAFREKPDVYFRSIYIMLPFRIRIAVSLYRLATGWTAEGSEFESRCKGEIFPFKLPLVPTKPPIERELPVKRPGREADHSYPTGAGTKNTWIYTSTPRQVFMA